MTLLGFSANLKGMFKVGQRWVSENEPELGLGLVQEVNKFQVHLLFALSEERRIFATDSPPLKRVAYKVGQEVNMDTGHSFIIESVEEREGLLYYLSGGQSICESEISDQSNFSNPEERLLQGQVDRSEAYALRYQTLQAASAARHSPVAGFIGGRIDLIPHQLYIAHEVASRHLPRVLLSDEVGLGKTIEACLILHRLALTGRASRILIVVPESLVHQWFVELFRRFNLWFTIMDADRCSAAAQQSESGNPFLEEQFVLCSIETLKADTRWGDLVSRVEWDLCVVDEAHHYQWTPNIASPEYQIIEAVSEKSAGLVLLTATPEQMGIEGHFARLRLLDKNRYPDLDTFIEEHNQYGAVAKIADAVFMKEALSAEEKGVLKKLLVEIPEKKFTNLLKNRDALLEALVDRHGTGRVIFRNTRKGLEGFPRRVVYGHPLKLGKQLTEVDLSARLRNEFELEHAEDLKHFLELERDEDGSPARENLESSASNDCTYCFKQDPRIDWLASLLKKLKKDKVLLICQSKAKVLAVQESLLGVLKVDSAVFHEDLSLIQRDRNAAYFAEVSGAQILLCSEIGSEGRNFQFAHHLVLFDLPLNPELLEQRIGRLDRIGQTEPIQIHVPFFADTWTAGLFQWHHEALNGMEQSLKGGHFYYEQFKSQLLDYGRACTGASSNSDFERLLKESTQYRLEMEQNLAFGQDCLIAINSYRPSRAKTVVSGIAERDASSELEQLMHALFDFFGVSVEQLESRRYFIKPEHLYTESFPELPEEGLQLTYHRPSALSREDIAFLTWDHPMVRGAMDLMLGGDFGTAAIVRMHEYEPDLPVLLLECIFVLESVAPLKFHVDRFLPPTPLRRLVDISGVDCTQKLSFEALLDKTEDEEAFRLKERPDVLESLLPNILESAHALAAKEQAKCIEAATALAKESLGAEWQRLLELKEVNANVTDAELQIAEEELRVVTDYISDAALRLDSVRLVINRPE